MKSFLLTLTLFLGFMSLQVLAEESATKGLTKGKILETEINLEGLSYKIEFREENPETAKFVQTIVPEITATIGSADWYIGEINSGIIRSKETPKPPDEMKFASEDARLCIVKMENGKAVGYWETIDDQYDVAPYFDFIDIALAVVDVQPGETIATDNSFYDAKYAKYSRFPEKFKLVREKSGNIKFKKLK